MLHRYVKVQQAIKDSSRITNLETQVVRSHVVAIAAKVLVDLILVLARTRLRRRGQFIFEICARTTVTTHVGYGTAVPDSARA